MRKFILCIASVAFLSATVPSQAMDISVGATTWYADWKIDDNTEEIETAMLYGPAVSFTFTDRIGLNSVFLLGDFDTDTNVTYRRYDSDTSLSYRLGSYFKVFAGLKYMAYRIEVEGMTMKMDSLGPAAGISLTLPLVYNFFAIANISGMYMSSEFSSSGEDFSSKTYGGNTTVALAYYIAPASVTLNVGYRYQYIKYYGDDMDSKHDIYGVTASATYSFSL